MPNNSPRRKEAARTIKRAVMKSHVKRVFKNYTENKSGWSDLSDSGMK